MACIMISLVALTLLARLSQVQQIQEGSDQFWIKYVDAACKKVYRLVRHVT